MGKKRRAEQLSGKNTVKDAAGNSAGGKTTAVSQAVGSAAAVKPTALSRQEERMAKLLAERAKKENRFAGIAAAVLALISAFATANSEKAVALFTMMAALGIVLWRRKRVGERFALPVIALSLYCVMVTVSCFYAPAGKFALQESLKIMLSFGLFLAVLGLEPKQGRVGHCTAMAVESSAAVFSLLSIDMAGASTVSALALKLFSLNGYYQFDRLSGSTRILSIFGNVNIFSGVAGLGILMALGLLSATSEKKERRWHLVCLGINSIAFVVSFSRGAMAVLAAAFLVYLFLERGESRGRALVVMIETLVLAGAASAVGFLTEFGAADGKRFAFLLAALVCTAALVVLDERVGVKLGDRLGEHTKAVMVSILALIGAVALVVLAALTLTGEAVLSSGEDIYRAAELAPGEYTLQLTCDGAADVSVTYQKDISTFSWNQTEIYSGQADGATFTVPEDSGIVFFRLFPAEGEERVTISEASYSGADSGTLKLRYLLLPESVASFLQGMFRSESFMQRRVLWQTGLTIWKQSPIIGAGIGSFENKLMGIQTFFFETKYVHNHYIQTLSETGVIGLTLFAAMLLSCAYVLFCALRKEERNPLLPALGASLLFMAGQAFTDVVFSAGHYLPSAFCVLALIVVCGEESVGEGLRVQKKARWLPALGVLVLAAWIVMLLMNLYAQSLSQRGTYQDAENAAKVDLFEYNDYKLSYVISAAPLEERDEEITEQMYKYLEELEKVPSNTIPRYLAECYFQLGERDKAFDMLMKYTAYVAADKASWDAAFALAQKYSDNGAEHLAGVQRLYRSMLDWNEANIGEIELDESNQLYLEMIGVA